jgi:PAS domain S-box-containing protein
VGKVNYFNLHPEEGRQEFKEQTMKLITETGCFNELANPIQKPDGSIIWVSSNGLPIYDEHGNLTGYRGSDQDITERLLAEKELRKFKTISDQSNYGAAITDLNGKLLYVNDQFAQMHGWNSKDLIHESLNILHNEQQLPKVNELLQELKAEGSMASMEVGHVRKDGSVFPTLMNASIIYDEHNLPIFMASTVIDITEITAAKLELLKLTQAVVQNPASIIITDPEGSIEYANPRFIEMMGYEAGEVIGEKSKLFLEGVIPDEMQKELLSTIRNGDVWKSEFENTKKNGEVFWENVSISPIKNETGDIVNFVAIMEDISERKELMEDLTNAKEKAQESDKLKTHFMNNISHEVRTPLNGILGFGDIMMQEGLTRDERLIYHKILIQSSNRLMKTIDDIMDISLINEGLIKPMFSAFLLPDLLESFIDRLKENCASGNIFVSLEIPPNAKDMVIHSDREMLGKILWQLLSNAAKFTSQGKINYGFLNLKNETQFYVKDTGQGIAADKLEVIFKPFVQEDVSSTRGYEGSGLGITIARGLVEVLGGKLWVESKKSKGTSVFFTLPLIHVKPEKEPVVNKTPRLQVLDNPVILIAEDDESNYQLMKAVIQRAGYSTLHAYNGADAVEFCHKFPEISLVFMDMKMPVMHGLEATALIKAFRPELPVVAVTAYAQTGDRQKMLQAGCDEYLAKPVKVNDLKDMIKKML